MKHLTSLCVLLFVVITSFSQSITPSQSDICSGSQTYTITGLPSGAIVLWHLTDNYAVATLSNQTSTSVDVNRINAVKGVETLTAAIIYSNSNCTAIRKTIFLGAPPSTFDIFGYYPLNPSCYQTESFYVFRPSLSTGDYPPAYQWSYRVTGTSFETTIPSTGLDGAFIFSSAGTYDILVRPVNSCGIGDSSVKTIDVVDPWVCSSFKIKVSPTPSNSTLTVTIDKGSKGNESLKIAGKATYQLLNINNGNVVKQWVLDNFTEIRTLNISDVKPGNYVLTVAAGEFKQSTQVLIKR